MRFKDLINNIKQDVFWQMATASCLALSIAYLSELALNLRPCILCIYQRLPYFFLLFISLLGIYKTSWKKSIRFIIVILLISEIALVSYHVGVEHYLFEENYTCQDTNQIGSILSTNSLLTSCSEVHFKFMNFSMAEWNLAYSIACLSFFIYRERKNGYFTW